MVKILMAERIVGIALDIKEEQTREYVILVR